MSAIAALGVTAVTTLGGAVTGMYVGDAMGSIPTTANVPATGAAATPSKVDSGGTPVTGATTPKQSLFMSAAIVMAALGILVLGSRYFKDARIG